MRFTWMNVSTLGLLHMLRCGCCESTLPCRTCLHAVYHQPTPLGIQILYFALLGKWQVENSTNKPFVHWMCCACLVHKICVYNNKWVYAQLITPTTRAATRFRTKIWTKKTSERDERAMISKTNCVVLCSWEKCRTGINFCENLKQS